MPLSNKASISESFFGYARHTSDVPHGANDSYANLDLNNMPSTKDLKNLLSPINTKSGYLSLHSANTDTPEGKRNFSHWQSTTPTPMTPSKRFSSSSHPKSPCPDKSTSWIKLAKHEKSSTQKPATVSHQIQNNKNSTWRAAEQSVEVATASVPQSSSINFERFIEEKRQSLRASPSAAPQMKVAENPPWSPRSREAEMLPIHRSSPISIGSPKKKSPQTFSFQTFSANITDGSPNLKFTKTTTALSTKISSIKPRNVVETKQGPHSSVPVSLKKAVANLRPMKFTDSSKRANSHSKPSSESLQDILAKWRHALDGECAREKNETENLKDILAKRKETLERSMDNTTKDAEKGGTLPKGDPPGYPWHTPKQSSVSANPKDSFMNSELASKLAQRMDKLAEKDNIRERSSESMTKRENLSSKNDAPEKPNDAPPSPFKIIRASSNQSVPVKVDAKWRPKQLDSIQPAELKARTPNGPFRFVANLTPTSKQDASPSSPKSGFRHLPKGRFDTNMVLEKARDFETSTHDKTKTMENNKWKTQSSHSDSRNSWCVPQSLNKDDKAEENVASSTNNASSKFKKAYSCSALSTGEAVHQPVHQRYSHKIDLKSTTESSISKRKDLFEKILQEKFDRQMRNGPRRIANTASSCTDAQKLVARPPVVWGNSETSVSKPIINSSDSISGPTKSLSKVSDLQEGPIWKHRLLLKADDSTTTKPNESKHTSSSDIKTGFHPNRDMLKQTAENTPGIATGNTNPGSDPPGAKKVNASPRRPLRLTTDERMTKDIDRAQEINENCGHDENELLLTTPINSPRDCSKKPLADSWSINVKDQNGPPVKEVELKSPRDLDIIGNVQVLASVIGEVGNEDTSTIENDNGQTSSPRNVGIVLKPGIPRRPLKDGQRVVNEDDPSSCTFWVTDITGTCKYLELDIESALNPQTTSTEHSVSLPGERAISRLQEYAQLTSADFSNDTPSSRRSSTPKKNRRRLLKSSLSFRSGSFRKGSKLRKSHSFSMIRS